MRSEQEEYMTKASALKKRYILFESQVPYNSVEFERMMYTESQKFFGEYGFSKVAFKIIGYDGKHGIIRCARDYVFECLGFLALLSQPRVIAQGSSGTIKSLKDRIKS